MIIECLAIFGIIFAVMMICILKKDDENDRKNAKLVAPLLILPGVNIVAYFCSEVISEIIPVDYFQIYLLIEVLAIIVSGILVGTFARLIESKGNKIAYISIFLIYTAVLSYFLMHEMLARVYYNFVESYNMLS